MKKILNEFNIFKMIKEDVKKFPITMIFVVMLILSFLGFVIAQLVNQSSEILDTKTVYSIFGACLLFLPQFLLIAYIVEYNIKSKGKGSIKNGLPYSAFVISKILIILVVCAFSGDDPTSKFAKQMSILLVIEILWLGIYNIPKIIYKIGIQERKKEKIIITLLKCLLASGIGYIYAPLITIVGTSIIGNIFM